MDIVHVKRILSFIVLWIRFSTFSKILTNWNKLQGIFIAKLVSKNVLF